MTHPPHPNDAIPPDSDDADDTPAIEQARRLNAAATTDRRGPDRRSHNGASPTGLERRRGPGRRRADDRRSAEEGEMTAEQFEFVMAVETYKKVNKRMYPTWTEILEVFDQLGYRKVRRRTIELTNVPEPELYAVERRKKDAA